ncbi:right-handed parallel beta-helix repeat-containing protein [Priestia aryabhattai]
MSFADVLINNILSASKKNSEQLTNALVDVAQTEYTSLQERLNAEQNKNNTVSKKVEDVLSVLEYAHLKIAIADGYDWTPVIQAALDIMSSLGKTVLAIPVGTYYFNKFLKTPSSITIFGAGKKTVFKALGNLNVNTSTGNNTGQFFEVHLVKDVRITNIYFDGQNFNAGAVCISGSTDVTVSHCYSYNSLVQAVTVANQGASIPKNINILFNVMENVLHGAQMWDAEDVLLLGNRVNKAKGGLWHAVSRKIRYLANYIENCEDVGIDMEGGEDCLASLNVVRACKNGELTFFKGNANSKNYGKNLVFANNIVIATDTYTKRDGTSEACGFGALTVHSINEDATEGLVFKDNHVAVYGTRTGFYTNVLCATTTGLCGVAFKSNKVYLKGASTKAHKLQSCVGIEVDDNEFIFEEVNDSTSEFKNCFKGTGGNNRYRFKKGRSGTGYAVLLYTDISAADEFEFHNNKVKNADQYALKIDAYQNAGKDMFVVKRNDLSDKPVTNGGVFQTANYGLAL